MSDPQNNSAIIGLKIQKIFEEVDSMIEILTPIMECSCKRTKFKFNLTDKLTINFVKLLDKY